MKKTKFLLSALAVISPVVFLASCGETYDFQVGVLQLVPHPALDAATNGFKAALTEAMEAAGKKVKIDVQNANEDIPLCSTIAGKFVSAKYDLVMGNATPALAALAAATSDIPVLGTSITDYGSALDIKDFNGTVGGNVSGTADLAPLDAQAGIIKELFPDAKTVGILYCSSETNSKYQADVVKAELAKLGITATDYTFSNGTDLTSVTTKACNESEVVYIPTDNTAAKSTGLIKEISVDTKTPIVAGEEGICGGCGVATLSISYEGIGRKTGEMAAKILLEGADISKMPVEFDENPVYKYNEELCNEFNVTVPSKYSKI